MLRGRHIVIGVTGGIAAYKAAYLVRRLQEAGAEVRVTMTDAAMRFVGRDTFAAITRHTVPVRIFPENSSGISDNWTQHIQWAEWADIMVIAPCTANTLAKVVHGFSDSMLTATILAARCPVLICPTMDGEMFHAPATRANLQAAENLGFHLMMPDEGYLASGMQGVGRLPDPEAIIPEIERILSVSRAPDSQGPQSHRSDEPSSADEPAAKADPGNPSSGSDPSAQKPAAGTSAHPLSGKTVLVTAGATREYLDPVRFLSNPSTGKMGFAMAEAAASLGAEVTLLHAESADLSRLTPGIRTKSFTDATNLFESVKKHASADMIIMTAAVSDFRPAQTSTRKVKKNRAEMHIPLERNPDILEWIGEQRSDRQVIIGFAMETENLLQQAREKRIRKKADWIVANDLSSGESGFAIDTNRVILVGTHQEIPFKGSKREVAQRVLHHILEPERASSA
ncbi:bifunctional phosphopantothenoylcysteine decarboxylase/phosphopantothenate synthase [Balneolales bacterium ANBcel1]|nr:bifunctional phosphopantothenoylcysteine decarboxylase/phosphopantothenate synthase [Balneolales bacterium ANBcel1]